MGYVWIPPISALSDWLSNLLHMVPKLTKHPFLYSIILNAVE